MREFTDGSEKIVQINEMNKRVCARAHQCMMMMMMMCLIDRMSYPYFSFGHNHFLLRFACRMLKMNKNDFRFSLIGTTTNHHDLP